MLCTKCKQKLKEKDGQWPYEVAGRVFDYPIKTLACEPCGQSFVTDEDLEAHEFRVARDLIQGPPHGESFKFIRKTMGLPLKELATIVGIPVQTLKEWESGEDEIETHVWEWLRAEFNVMEDMKYGKQTRP